MDIAEGVKDADLIIIGSPVSSIPALVARAAKFAKPGAVITDVGSTKAYIVARAEKLLGGSRVNFVGSHPMAGSEKTGVESARGDLLEGSPCIVTRTKNTGRADLSGVTSFWRSLGANVKVMSPAEHDEAVSLVSHLPHIVAFSLAGAVPPDALEYAAEGFKDTTRVASSDPELWADILLTNKSNILKAAGLFKKRYGAIVSAISRDDRRRVIKELAAAGRKREIFLNRLHGNKKA
jgi:prephenate dehydrogenase